MPPQSWQLPSEPPTPQPAPQPEPPRPRRRRGGAFLLVLLLLLLASAGAGYGGYAYRGLSAKADPIVASPTPKAAADVMLTDKASLDYVLGTGAVSPTITSDPTNISFTAPVAARPQIGGFNCDADVSTNCRRYPMVDWLGSPTSDIARNSITVYPVLNWLQSATTRSENKIGTFAGLTDAKTKQARYDAVANLTKDSQIQPEDVTGKLLNPFITNAAQVGVSDVRYIESADGKLKGYRYITSLLQGEGYQPRAMSVLTGNIKGVPVLVMGEFMINDNLKATKEARYKKLFGASSSEAEQKLANDEIQAFAKLYVNGYRYADDTLNQAEAAAKIMRTVSITPQSR